MTDLTRSNIKGAYTKEFLTSFEWDFKFDRFPDLFGSESGTLADTIRLRCTNVQTPEEPVNNPVSIEIRGQRYSQPGLVNHYGSFAFVIQDFADTAVQKPFMSLIYEMCDPFTKAMARSPKSYMFDCRIFQLNSTREVVKVWVCKDCQIVSAAVTDDMSGDKTPVGQVSLTFTTDFYTVEYATGSEDKSTYYNVSTLNE